MDGAYGYQVVKRTQNDGIEKPDAASLFDEHTGTVNKETTVAVTGLETGCSYVLYAAVRRRRCIAKWRSSPLRQG